MRQVAAAGEPWHTFFSPAQLQGELRRLGFATVRDFGRDEINNARFFSITPARGCASAGSVGWCWPGCEPDQCFGCCSISK